MSEFDYLESLTLRKNKELAGYMMNTQKEIVCMYYINEKKHKIELENNSISNNIKKNTFFRNKFN